MVFGDVARREENLVWRNAVVTYIRNLETLFGLGYNERNIGSASPWVTGAASSGSRKEELVERNASVALKTAVTEIRDSEQHDRSVGAGAGIGVVIRPPSSPLVPLGVTRTHREYRLGELVA